MRQIILICKLFMLSKYVPLLRALPKASGGSICLTGSTIVVSHQLGPSGDLPLLCPAAHLLNLSVCTRYSHLCLKTCIFFLSLNTLMSYKPLEESSYNDSSFYFLMSGMAGCPTKNVLFLPYSVVAECGGPARDYMSSKWTHTPNIWVKPHD